MQTHGRRMGQGVPGKRTCAVRLGAAGEAGVAARRETVVVAPSAQLRSGKLRRRTQRVARPATAAALEIARDAA